MSADEAEDAAEVERRQVVVVGSGFGGAVTACRLAQAGCDVLVLERGRWYHGDFPRDAGDDWFWGSQGGPFDVRRLGDVNVVTAAGVGGGSLLYSNVHLRMPADGFERRWPSGWSREALDPYYDLVASMLNLRRADEDEAQEYWLLPERSGCSAMPRRRSAPAPTSPARRSPWTSVTRGSGARGRRHRTLGRSAQGLHGALLGPQRQTRKIRVEFDRVAIRVR
jgi:choline dehydrogenase-like flavoprotein